MNEGVDTDEHMRDEGVDIDEHMRDEGADTDEYMRDEGADIGPASHSDLATGEDYTEPENISDVEYPTSRRSDTLYISGRTNTQHPVSELCDSSLFESVGTIEKKMGPTHEIGPGKIFQSKKQLSFAVCHFSVTNNVEVRTQTSNSEKIIMICSKWDCPWRLYGRPEKMGTRWKIIKNETEHTCSRNRNKWDHDNLTAGLIAETIREELRTNLGLDVSTVGSLIKMRYPQIKPKYNKLWRGRERAIEQLFGTWEGSYDTFPRLLAAIQETTPGTKYQIASSPTNDRNVKIFKYAAWAYGPCIEAVQYLRPVISIDAGFLSGRYQGRLLMVCGYDAENRVLPIAFGLVQKEEEASWGWFMSWVRHEVIGPDVKLCVISDRHKGIKAVFDSIHYGWHIHSRTPLAVHRYCMQHVAENLYKEVGGTGDKTLKDQFKCQLANKKKPRRFREKWLALKISNNAAREYLKKVGKDRETDEKERPKFEKWAQSFDKGHRWGIMTSNGSESLNSVFRIERRLPVTAIVEGTWYKCAAWFNKRKNEAINRSSHGERWPKFVQDKLDKHDHKAGAMTVITLGIDRGEFEVQVPCENIEGGGFRPFKYTVQMPPELEPSDHQRPFTGARCECQKPQLTGIPCSHLLAVCKEIRYDVNAFVDTRYGMWNLLKTWSGQFHSYGDEDTWPNPNRPKLIPDRTLINRGRRKKIRKQMTMDEMERGKQKQKEARKKRKSSRTEVPSAEQPLPMVALQSGRRTSRPPSRSSFQDSRATLKPGRLSLNLDPRRMNNADTTSFVQPRRASISVDPRHSNNVSEGIRAESARFPTRSTRIAEGRETGNRGQSKETRGKRIGEKIRGFFSKSRKQK